MEVACAIITHIYQHFLQNDLIFIISTTDTFYKSHNPEYLMNR
jgi:hypothetical protein